MTTGMTALAILFVLGTCVLIMISAGYKEPQKKIQIGRGRRKQVCHRNTDALEGTGKEDG